MFFVVEHNRNTKETDVKQFTDYDKANALAFEKEKKYVLQGRREMEVVVFETDSLETLKQTHSRYFAEPTDNLKALGAIGLVGLAVYLLTKKTK